MGRRPIAFTLTIAGYWYPTKYTMIVNDQIGLGQFTTPDNSKVGEPLSWGVWESSTLDEWWQRLTWPNSLLAVGLGFAYSRI